MEALSFAEFQPLLAGLLSADTRLWRRFTRNNNNDDQGGDDE